MEMSNRARAVARISRLVAGDYLSSWPNMQLNRDDRDDLVDLLVDVFHLVEHCGQSLSVLCGAARQVMRDECKEDEQGVNDA